MSVIKVYKVKDLDTGMFRTAGGGWSRTGKTWSNLGRLKNSISGEGYYGYSNSNNKDLPEPNIVIMEIIVQETEGNISPLSDLITRERRMIQLDKKYGDSFKNLVRRIEDQGQSEQFQWVLAAKGKWDRIRRATTGDFEELMTLIKQFKLKQNVDYKKASSFNTGGAVAFARKQDAMRVRLAMKGQAAGIDIKNYVETNLDEPSKDALNSST